MISRQHRFSLYVIVSVLLGVWMDVAGGMSIQLIPQYPVIRGSVTLSVTGIIGRLQSIIWYKGPNLVPANQILVYLPGAEPATVRGPLFHDRMTVSPDGSLMISDLNISDEGNYTAKIQSDKSDDIYVIMKIYEKVGKPTITASISNPKENDTVTLTCTSTHVERIVWSRVPSGATLSSDNRTISFSMINRSDAGDYSCTAANPVSKESSDSFKITVAYGPENVNINVRIISASSVSLECSANSVPPSTYHWKRNGTDIKDKPNPLQVDQMKDEGTYTCVATNSVTKLTATHSTYVNATIEETPQDTTNNNIGLIVGVVIASVILLLVLVCALVYLFVIQKRRKKHSNEKGSTKKSKSTSRNGQTIPSAAAPEPPELEYADIVFSKNMPKRQQPAPETVYANRAALAHPPDVVYSDLRLNRP